MPLLRKENLIFSALIFIFILGFTILALIGYDSLFFMVCTQLYLIIFGSINLFYTIKSRNSPTKRKMSGYLINEILVAIGFYVLAILYPFLFNFVDISIRQMLYFHLWDSLTVHLFCWKIYLYFASRNNIKYNRNLNYEQWKSQYLSIYNNTNEFKKDIKRKLTHFYPALAIIGFFYLGQILEPFIINFGLSGIIFTHYWQFAIGIHFLWMINIADLLRLNKFKRLGKFATRWFNDALRPSELETFAQGSIMILSWFPFMIAPSPILFDVVLISSISDGLASLIGIKFGKISIKGTKKKLEGTIAGFIATYLIVIGVNLILPFQDVNVVEVNLIALCAAIGFVLVDIFSKNISDNLLNSIITGGIIWILLLVFGL